jgi:SAM-dependent methyltransferase
VAEPEKAFLCQPAAEIDFGDDAIMAKPADHDAIIVDQFTKQAEPFAAMPAHADADIVRLILDAARLTPQSRVLDVACGPGLVAFALAEIAQDVTGLDLTPAMLEKARELQRQKGLPNLSWDLGRADSLPYPENSLDAAVTRFSFHHLLRPDAALAEMMRVCRPGGRVVVCDVYTSSNEQAAEYDRLERLRDRSHVHALRLDELRALMAKTGFAEVEEAFCRLPMGLDQLLAASFPVEGGADEIRRAFAEDLGRNRLGLGVREQKGIVVFAFPIVVLAGTKPSC